MWRNGWVMRRMRVVQSLTSCRHVDVLWLLCFGMLSAGSWCSFTSQIAKNILVFNIIFWKNIICYIYSLSRWNRYFMQSAQQLQLCVSFFLNYLSVHMNTLLLNSSIPAKWPRKLAVQKIISPYWVTTYPTSHTNCVLPHRVRACMWLRWH